MIPRAFRQAGDRARWNAFVSRCKVDFHLDPEKDGEIVAAEQLGRRDGHWRRVWERFAESPTLFPGIPERLRQTMPHDLFADRSSWPQFNEEGELALRNALVALADTTSVAAREQVIELENTHGERRDWVWAKLGQASLAGALAHLAALAERASSALGGASIAEMAKLYTDGAWEIDAAALSSMAAVKSFTDSKAVSGALDAIYRPWLESAARHVQALAEKEPLPGRGEQEPDDARVEPGGAILFADGLRFDVSHRLVERLRTKDRSVAMSIRWAGLPSVTATAKPAVSPVAEHINGVFPRRELPSGGGGFRTSFDHRPVPKNSWLPLATSTFARTRRGIHRAKPGPRTANSTSWAIRCKGSLPLGLTIRSSCCSKRIEALLDAGWHEVRVVTDHGWLWLPGGLPKVDLPEYLTLSRWARCAAIEHGAKVEVPTVAWHWNALERVAVGPGIACFGAGNKYAHGGLSLQESLVPVLRVTAGASSAKAGREHHGCVLVRIAVQGTDRRRSVRAIRRSANAS